MATTGISLRHRAEIDGLRAVAVLPVMLFHAHFSIFGGGYLGVDVFFVISGYLITSILVDEIGAGEFSLLRFYERRARRILPALFTVVFCTIPFAWLWMTPDQFQEFGRSLAAVALFASNFFFWLQEGYFATGNELKPMLHTWSLAVEEQFYLIFPLVLLALSRLGLRVSFQVVALLALASLILSEVGSRNWPTANFYLAPTRAFELLAGAICAFVSQRRAQRSSETLSAIGLATVLAAMLLYRPTLPIPSLYALLPVGGTVLIILFGSSATLVGRFLGARILVGLGLVSYSAYLWHQPIFALVRIRSLTPPGSLLMLALIGLSLMLAYVTWRFVEQPFRRRPNGLMSRRQIFMSAALMSIALGWATFAISVVRMPTALEISRPDLFRSEGYELAEYVPCPGFDEIAVGVVECSIYGSGDDLVVLWGDSHLVMLRYGITPLPGTRVMTLTHAGCPPAVGVSLGNVIQGGQSCADTEILGGYFDYINAMKPSAIVLVGRWMLYLDDWKREGEKAFDRRFMHDAETREIDSQSESAAALRRGLARAINGVAPGVRVFLVAQPPDLSFMTGRARLLSDGVAMSDIAKVHATELDMLSALTADTPVELIDAKALLCDSTTCKTRLDGFPLYFDDNHLMPRGERLLWDEIVRRLKAN
ncbi:MAG: acyltransferase family protein [Deltaproteobacteria bacterium]